MTLEIILFCRQYTTHSSQTMKNIGAILWILVGMSPFASAQTTKQTTQVGQTWLAYMNQTRLTNKLGVWTDIHLRTKEEVVSGLSLAIFRVGGMYYLADNTKFTVGYAFVNHFPAENHQNISQPEHRPWQQIQWQTKYTQLRTTQWIRLEERFRRKIKNDNELAEGYAFNYRVRYNIQLLVPLSKRGTASKTLAWVVNDEVHVNFGNEITYNYFDQNRFFTGIAYHLNDHDNVQVGYMNVFQQLAAGNRYRSTHALRIFYFHNLDLRRKEGDD